MDNRKSPSRVLLFRRKPPCVSAGTGIPHRGFFVSADRNGRVSSTPSLGRSPRVLDTVSALLAGTARRTYQGYRQNRAAWLSRGGWPPLKGALETELDAYGRSSPQGWLNEGKDNPSSPRYSLKRLTMKKPLRANMLSKPTMRRITPLYHPRYTWLCTGSHCGGLGYTAEEAYARWWENAQKYMNTDMFTRALRSANDAKWMDMMGINWR